MNPHRHADDATLARLARDGGADAFGELVRRHHARVFGFLLALTRHRQDAEDLTQDTFLRAWDRIRGGSGGWIPPQSDTFLRAWDRIHRYDPSLPMQPWLLTIARRLSIAALRRKRDPQAMPPPLPDGRPVSQALQLWEHARSVLGESAYAALWLHYREDLPLKQVAGILGKREGAVKVMLHRARKTLAESLKPTPPQPPPLPAGRFSPNPIPP